MKNIRKIIFAVILAVSMVFSFGCGAGGSTTVSDTTMAEETTASDTTAADTEPADTEPIKPDPPEYEFPKIIFTDSFERCHFTASNGVELPYCLYIPENYSEEYAYPTLLFLHGAGTRSLENGPQLTEGVQSFFIPKGTPAYNCIGIFPVCPPDGAWSPNEWAGGSYSMDEYPMTDQLLAVVELLDYIAETYSTNPLRQYVTGFSMGGYGTWALLTNYPDRFAAAAPVCGGGDPTYADKLVDIPIWTCHNESDTIVSVSATRDMVTAIIAAGGENIKYEEKQDSGHNAWDPLYRNPEFQEWLFSQRKK